MDEKVLQDILNLAAFFKFAQTEPALTDFISRPPSVPKDFIWKTRENLVWLLGKLNLSLQSVQEWLLINKTIFPTVPHLSWNPESFYNVLMSGYPIEQGDLNIYYAISTSNQSQKLENDNRVDILSITRLAPYKEIPALFLYKYSMEFFVEEKRWTKLLSHYNFITEAIKKLFYSISLKDIEEFILTNQPIINSIIKNFFQTSRPKLLGVGSDGVAFDVGGGFVLKIFLDHVAYQKAQEAIERLHKHPAIAKTEAMIYDVGILGSIAETTIYYYVIEKMTPIDSLPNIGAFMIDFRIVSSEIKNRLQDDWMDKWRPVKRGLADEKYSTKELESISRRIKEEAERMSLRIKNVPALKGVIKNIENNVELKPSWIADLIEEMMMKYLTGRSDLHLGNLGLGRHGNLRYFDPAFSDWETGMN